MKYINTSKKRKLISIRQTKRWVAPGEKVDLNNTDVRFLGANGTYMIPIDIYKKMKSDKSAKKENSTTIKSDVKNYFTNMTKQQLEDFADNIGLQIKTRDLKEKIIDQLMEKSKEIGYSKVMEKLS